MLVGSFIKLRFLLPCDMWFRKSQFFSLRWRKSKTLKIENFENQERYHHLQLTATLVSPISIGWHQIYKSQKFQIFWWLGRSLQWREKVMSSFEHRYLWDEQWDNSGSYSIVIVTHSSLKWEVVGSESNFLKKGSKEGNDYWRKIHFFEIKERIVFSIEWLIELYPPLLSGMKIRENGNSKNFWIWFFQQGSSRKFKQKKKKIQVSRELRVVWPFAGHHHSHFDQMISNFWNSKIQKILDMVPREVLIQISNDCISGNNRRVFMIVGSMIL